MINQELERYDVMEQVSIMVNDYITKGVVNPSAIAKGMGLKRAEVLTLLDHWHSIARNNQDIKDRATELILELDLTYSGLIEELHNVLEEAENPRDKNTTIKNIADITAKRQEVYQRAGIYDDAAIADELAMMEQKLTAIQSLLTRVAENFPDTKGFIIEGIGKIMGKPEAMPTGNVPDGIYVPSEVKNES